MKRKVSCSGTCQEHDFYAASNSSYFKYLQLCRRRDSNPHASRRHPLEMVCLPIPPLRLSQIGIRALYFFRSTSSLAWAAVGPACSAAAAARASAGLPEAFAVVAAAVVDSAWRLRE